MQRRTQGAEVQTARARLRARAQAVGCRLGSIGDLEQLAGVDVRNQAQRFALWWQFRELFAGPTQPLIDAVMEACATEALRRLDAGELCLLPG